MAVQLVRLCLSCCRECGSCFASGDDDHELTKSEKKLVEKAVAEGPAKHRFLKELQQSIDENCDLALESGESFEFEFEPAFMAAATKSLGISDSMSERSVLIVVSVMTEYANTKGFFLELDEDSGEIKLTPNIVEESSDDNKEENQRRRGSSGMQTPRRMSRANSRANTNEAGGRSQRNLNSDNAVSPRRKNSTGDGPEKMERMPSQVGARALMQAVTDKDDNSSAKSPRKGATSPRSNGDSKNNQLQVPQNGPRSSISSTQMSIEMSTSSRSRTQKRDSTSYVSPTSSQDALNDAPSSERIPSSTMNLVRSASEQGPSPQSLSSHPPNEVPRAKSQASPTPTPKFDPTQSRAQRLATQRSLATRMSTSQASTTRLRSDEEHSPRSSVRSASIRSIPAEEADGPSKVRRPAGRRRHFLDGQRGSRARTNSMDYSRESDDDQYEVSASRSTASDVLPAKRTQTKSPRGRVITTAKPK